MKDRSMGMTKSELIDRLVTAFNPSSEEGQKHIFRREDAKTVIDTILGEITDALARGDRVELRGFATFSVKEREARVGRNPRTGETVHVPSKRVPYFKAGKEIRDRLMADE